ncbi:hypothetical protein SeMB42_g02075 [Synchytrium endobioticum]|uniref:GATA-type domain-containing protein n=1 Tax=Synchytrium endobioticum TaxID=286115 RepID=A0A507DHS4_9FUNG|nr:hypothetical protein SeLEV6574_g05557 [Synchytrium endobioticum]TPX50951.1 hypothetical protein SeMB42_g02075 [Synchytrium endobioticum]
MIHRNPNKHPSRTMLESPSRLPTPPPSSQQLNDRYALRSSTVTTTLPPVTPPSPPNVAVEKYCTYCHTGSTPMWRHGPPPYDLLCNSCGVKYRRGKIILDGNNPPRKRVTPPPKPFKPASSSISTASALLPPNGVAKTPVYPSPRRSTPSPVVDARSEMPSIQYSPPSPAPSQRLSMSPCSLLGDASSLPESFSTTDPWTSTDSATSTTCNYGDRRCMILNIDEFTKSITTLYNDEEMDNAMVVEPQSDTIKYTLNDSHSKLAARLAAFSSTLRRLSVAQVTAIYAVVEKTLLDEQRQLLATGQVVDFDLKELLLNDEAWNQMMRLCA